VRGNSSPREEEEHKDDFEPSKKGEIMTYGCIATPSNHENNIMSVDILYSDLYLQ